MSLFSDNNCPLVTCVGSVTPFTIIRTNLRHALKANFKKERKDISKEFIIMGGDDWPDDGVLQLRVGDIR